MLVKQAPNLGLDNIPLAVEPKLGRIFVFYPDGDRVRAQKVPTDHQPLYLTFWILVREREGDQCADNSVPDHRMPDHFPFVVDRHAVALYA